MSIEAEPKALLESENSFAEAPEKAEELDATFLLFRRLPLAKLRTFLLFIGISFALLFHWFSTSELFTVPSDVVASRESFFKAKESYFQNSTYWDAKQKHFVEKLSEKLATHNDLEVLREVQEIPGEIFISFLLKKLHLGLDRLEKTAVFSKSDAPTCTLILSKPENSIWPSSIMLALEVELKVHAERFSLSVTRLRRGTQDIALSLAWTYFGPELESIRQLEATSKQSFILLSKSPQQK